MALTNLKAPIPKNLINLIINTFNQTITVSWGAITGTLSDQTDLQNALDTKVALAGNQTIAGVKEFTNGLVAFRAINPNNTVTYTLALSDRGTYIRCTANNDQTITIPANTTIAFSIGTEIEFIRTTTNEVEFDPEMGVTVNSVDGNKRLNKRYSAAVLKKIGTDEWDLIGDLKA